MPAAAVSPSIDVDLGEERAWLAFLQDQAGQPAPRTQQRRIWQAFLEHEIATARAAPAVAKRLTEDAWQAFLRDLVAGLGPDAAAVVVAGAEKLRKDLDDQALEEAIASGAPVLVEAAIPWSSLANILRDGSGEVPGLSLTVERGAGEAGLRIALDLEHDFAAVISREPLYERAARYARTRGSGLVTGITEASRDGVRQLVAEAYAEGRSVEATGRALREVLGLDAQRALALDRYIQQLVTNPELSAAQIQRRIDQRFGKLLRQRGQTVAQTELWMAGNVGQLETWREAAAQGEVDIRGLGKLFVSNRGETAAHPTIHPRCYCSVRLVRQEVAGVVFYVRQWVVAYRNPCERCLAFNGKLAA